MVLDNGSTDGSADIARDLGVEVVALHCNQPDALNQLLNASRSPFTLLLHSDVILLSDRWFSVCKAHLQGAVAMVSPEDIGCGPYSRPFGIGMPESSFMLLDTMLARQIKTTFWSRWHGIPWPRRAVDFYGPHVTHRLPERLRTHGFNWKPMNVLISPTADKPIYVPAFKPGVWSAELAYLKYGLGNFYSLDGEITHYHNWYDRVPKIASDESEETTGRGGTGFPAAYVKRYTESFLSDYTAGRLALPSPAPSPRQPKAL